MVLTEEQKNFVKLANVILDLIPKHLRNLFIKLWNEEFHSIVSGEYIWSAIPAEIQNDKELFPQDVQKKILNGNEESWDATLLIFLLLGAQLKLIESCRRDRKLPLRMSERIDNIRVIRNTFFGYAPRSELSDAEYITISTELRCEVLHTFGVDAVKEIDAILTLEFETQLTVDLRDRLEREIQLNILLEENLEAKDTNFDEKLFDLSSKEFTLPDRSTSIYKLVERYILVEPSSSSQRHRQRDPQEALLRNKDEMMERLSNEENSNGIPAESQFSPIQESMEKDLKGEFADGIEEAGDPNIMKRHSQTFEAIEMESELSTEDANFVKIAKILLDIIPKYLRSLFKKTWNNKYRDQQWESDSSSGSLLLSKLPEEINNNSSNKAYIDQLKTGDEQRWDTNTLLFVLLHSNLSLIQRCRPTNERISPLLISEEILSITNVRNKFFHSLPFGTCSADDFAKIIADITLVAKNVFGKVADSEIEKVVRSDILSLTIKLNEHVQDDDVHQKQELSREEENFLKIGKIVVTIIPKYLLICLKMLWNQKHPQEKWQGNGRSKERLLKELQSVEHGSMGGSIVHRIKARSEHEWDGTTLLHILLNSGLLSADEYLTEEQRSIATLVSEELDKIKEINQMFYELASCMSCPSVMFLSIIEKIKSVAKNILGENGENEINIVANARIRWKILSANTATR